MRHGGDAEDIERRLSASIDPAWRRRLGQELRRRRTDRGLTQSALGAPLSKAFVSAVEHGRSVPSLPALRLMTTRLDTTLGEFLTCVEEESTAG
jgi:transcriptional regulator with XRE-family HTH domain